MEPLNSSRPDQAHDRAVIMRVQQIKTPGGGVRVNGIVHWEPQNAYRACEPCSPCKELQEEEQMLRGHRTPQLLPLASPKTLPFRKARPILGCLIRLQGTGTPLGRIGVGGQRTTDKIDLVCGCSMRAGSINAPGV